MIRRVDRRLLWIGLLILVVAVTFVSGSRRRAGPPFDPDSTEPDGARGLVVLLGQLGTDVDVTDDVPGVGDTDVVLVLEDRMPTAQADEVEEFARHGGTVVVADGSSLLSPRSVSLGGGELRGRCDDGSLPDVGAVAVDDAARGFVVGNEPSTVSCFEQDGHALIVADEVGAGRIISLGAPAMFTNRNLDEADNAVLAAALLGGDDVHLTFLTPSATEVGTGDRSLSDLVPNSVRAVLWQGVVVFAFAVWWKGRRLGAPVPEPQPVAIAGSELTRAVGRLLAANRRPDRAAAFLRDRARIDLAPRLGLTPDASADAVADALGRATSLDPVDIHRATVAPITTDDELLVVAQLLSRIREEVLHGIHPTR